MRKHEKVSETATEEETRIDSLSSCCLICWRVSCSELAWGPESESHTDPLPLYPSGLPEDLKDRETAAGDGRDTGVSIMSVLIATQQIDTAASSNMVRNFQ